VEHEFARLNLARFHVDRAIARDFDAAINRFIAARGKLDLAAMQIQVEPTRRATRRFPMLGPAVFFVTQCFGQTGNDRFNESRRLVTRRGTYQFSRQ